MEYKEIVQCILKPQYYGHDVMVYGYNIRFFKRRDVSLFGIFAAMLINEMWCGLLLMKLFFKVLQWVLYSLFRNDLEVFLMFLCFWDSFNYHLGIDNFLKYSEILLRNCLGLSLLLLGAV